MTRIVDGARRSPNIWDDPRAYELENRAVDPDGVIPSAMAAIRPWVGATVLDVGCGTGFYLPQFAEQAGKVIGLEPHGGLLGAARRRCTGLGLRNVEFVHGSAQAMPIPDASVDLVHARWAYFFGPGCEPGLRELDRVVRRGGVAFVIDNDPTRSTFGRWFRRGFPSHSAEEVQRFWSRRGWRRTPLDMRWRFDRREDLEAVVRIEFPPDVAAEVLQEHAGLEVDYAINLFWRLY